MEAMLKYAFFMIVLASAIAYTAHGDVQYTATLGTPIPDELCAKVAGSSSKTATIPQDLWSGTVGGCVEVTISDATGSFPTKVLVVGGAGNDNNFILSADAFNAIATEGASSVNIIYTPPQ